MAFDVMQSLFGLTPSNVQQMMRAEEEARARTQVNLLQGNPFAAGAYAPLQAGERMLSGTRQLAGMTDPRMQAAQGLQAIIGGLQQQGVDMATPEGMIQLASALNTNPEFAGMSVALRQQASKMAMEQEKTQADIELRKAQTAKALREPAAKESLVKTPVDFAAVASELGFGVKPNLADYSAEESKAVNKELQNRKLARAEAGAPKPTPTEKAIMPGKAKTFANIEEGALQAAKTVQTADAIDRVLNTAFTGFGADVALKASQIANAFGVTVTGTSETEQLKQLLAQLAQGQAKTLPGALSEKELAFLREAIGTPGFTVQTLRNVVNRLRKDATTAEIENQLIQDYVSQGGDINKYNFVAKRKEAQGIANQQLTDQQAKLRRLQELRQKKQGAQ